ncbi:MAG: 1-(5-phosphoribosyl)-5-[(5-phosphoribosylamino)methylideneamino]imidazole-4-carboxamide isomerase [Oscillospiraceae bacterium]|nr:1-(5-phosphoribosyl)-5-[(5-phosphoribosylamino)methylideneamino]imidazole-4-carboxamide isomerase [Oscillospiraceae bacterium]
MLIFPAIDIYGGKAVRLARGDYAAMTVYGEPLDFARRFAADGADALHVVDLEGARDGGTPNFDAVREIIAATGLPVEVGGGVRSRETAARYLGAGAARVILGTAALGDRELLVSLVAEFGDKIAVGVDARDGKAAARGWTDVTDTDAFGFCRELAALGVKTLICTDIAKDGVLGGANHAMYAALQPLDVNVVASGGVSTLADIETLCGTGVYGAVIGRALYENTVSLRDAAAAARR